MRSVLSALALLLLTSAPSWAPAQASRQTHAKPLKALSAKEIYSRYRGAMVQIKTTAHEYGGVVKGSGSGFFYRAPNMIATAYHVVFGAESIEIVNSQGVKFQPVSLLIDADSDVALIKVAAKTSGPILKGKLYAKVEVGETVYAIGNPLGRFPDTITAGIVSSKRKYANTPVIQMSAAISKGNSGGPLIDDQGNAVGIVDAYSTEGQNTNFAIAMNQADALLKSPDVYEIGPFLAFNREAPTRIEIQPGAKTRPRLLHSVKLPAAAFETAVSPDGGFVAVSTQKEVAIYSVADGKAIHRSQTPDTALELLYPSADKLFIFYGSTLEIRNPKTWDVIATHEVDPEVWTPRLSATGDAMYYGTADPDEKDEDVLVNWRVVRLNLKSGERTILRASLNYGAPFAFNKQEDKLFVIEEIETAKQITNRLLMVEVANGESSTLREFQVPGNPAKGMVMDDLIQEPESARISLVIVDRAGEKLTLERFSTETGKQVETPKVALPMASDFLFAGSGQRLLGDSLEAMHAFDLERGAEEFHIAHDGFGFSASPDGSVLAIPHSDTVRIYTVFPVSYVGTWDWPIDPWVIDMKQDGSMVMTATMPYEGKEVTSRILGTWKDLGDRFTITCSKLEIDGLLDTDAKEVEQAKKMLMQRSPLTIEPIWVDKDTFTVGTGSAKLTYRRKSGSLPESKQ